MGKGPILGIDIGGTKIAVAVAGSVEDARDGTYAALVKEPVPGDRRPQTVVQRIAAIADDLLGGDNPSGIGISIGGPLDHERGIVVNFPHLPEWRDLPMTSIIEERFQSPATLDNDANLAALAEFHVGGLEKPDLPFVYLTLSTGIGGGILIDRKVLHGFSSGGGELGHVTVDPTGPICPCGNRGCLEAVASGTNVARRAREAVAGDPEGGRWLRDRVADAIEEIRAEEVVEGVKAGDRLCTEIWQETIEFLAIGLGSIVHVVSPGEIRLGGGLALAGETLLVPLRKAVTRRVGYIPIERITLSTARLGHDSSIIGALLEGARATTGSYSK